MMTGNKGDQRGSRVRLPDKEDGGWSQGWQEDSDRGKLRKGCGSITARCDEGPDV